MALDMSQFYQVFFEETAEHLGSMEALLLDLDIQQPDPEQLNAIFRAAHSIKGSSGTFGFTDLTEVTHILENLLDRIRKDELPLRADMIDAFLDAGDVLKTLLDAHRGTGSADPQAVATICARMKALTQDAPAASIAPIQPAAPPPQATATALPATGYAVRFILDTPDNAPAAENIANVIGALSVFGSVELHEHATAAGQPWCLGIDAAPGGTLDLDHLREMLEFVARSDSIRIEPLRPLQTPHDTATTEDAAYGLFDSAPDHRANTETATETDHEAYGLFDLTPAEVSKAEAAEPYGLFDELPAAPVPVPPVATADDTQGAYGFFAPDSASGSASAPTVAAPAVAPPLSVSESAPAPSAPPRTERRTPLQAGDTSIRVNIEKVDQLINLVGELVITQAMLAQSAAAVDPVLFERLHAGLGQLERNTRDLQESVMSIRMMPISVVFSRFPRVVRDTAQKLNKEVELRMDGEHTELDKSLIERIADPLTHLIRNSLDHGIEAPAARIAAGKPALGTITLKAFHEGGNIVIEVGDNGAGLNRARILAKARERGMSVSDAMSDGEVWALIFEAGFSTAEQVTEVSGRGVGMDVVKRNISALGGRIEIESMAGLGTRMTVRLPLTLAILDGISVAVGEEIYIIPIGCVIESLQIERTMVKSVSGVDRLIQVRGDYLPVLVLHDLFAVPGAVEDFSQGIMVVLGSGGSRFALLVDALVGQHQVVIKSLEANYRKVAGISSATIMGDGRVAMILDVATLAGMVATPRAAPSSLAPPQSL
ncbi:MAG: chemotaxis protein CheW [Sterolibacterium sp.]|jgi:two-component system chemotaxis sensor kinase CheA|nr:chemotaxis protein CheW [Sterolibacterium sp.]